MSPGYKSRISESIIIFVSNLATTKDPKRTTSVAEAVVLELMDGFVMQGCCLCTDNWYTSLSLAHSLLKKKTDMVGTPRRNRKSIPQILRDRKLQRGEFIYKQNLKGVLVLKWQDKKDIHMMSTKHDASCHPNGKPLVVADYNMMKGFVDFSDQMAAYTPFVRKTTKWYIRLFFHLVTQTALVNAWFFVLRESQENQNQLLQRVDC